jgi:hypothetical protein
VLTVRSFLVGDSPAVDLYNIYKSIHGDKGEEINEIMENSKCDVLFVQTASTLTLAKYLYRVVGNILSKYVLYKKSEVPCKNSLQFLGSDMYGDIKRHVQWPYVNFSEYIERRAAHLSPYITWSSEIERSKAYINTLKSTLIFYYPDQYAPIATCEGHVRLSCSLWYAFRFTMYVLCAAVIISFVFVLINFLISFQLSLEGVYFLSISFVSLGLVNEFKVKVQKVIHYQRLRELIAIFHLVHITYKEKPEIWKEMPFYRATSSPVPPY